MKGTMKGARSHQLFIGSFCSELLQNKHFAETKVAPNIFVVFILWMEN